MKKRSMIVMAAILVLTMGLVLAGCNNQQEQSEVDQSVSVGVAVTVQTAKEGTLPGDRTYIGSIAAEESGTVVAQATGTITKLYVTKGEAVKKGQLIAEIDNTKQQLDVKEQETKLASAIARLAQAKASQIADAGEASSSQALAKQALDNARESYERVKIMVEAGALPAAQLNVAKDEWLRAQNSYRTSSQSDAKDLAGIKVSAADVEAANIAVERAKRALVDTKITAPLDGMIDQLPVSIGDLVTTQGAVAEIVSLDRVVIIIHVAEDALSSLEKGKRVQLSIPSLGTKTEGEVSFVGMSTLRETMLYPVEIRLVNSSSMLRPGMRADVTLTGSQEQKGIVLPLEAVMDQDEKQYVFLVKNGHARKREVKKIDANASAVLIGQGLAPGDVVVVSGQADLQDGAQVNIMQNDDKGE